MGKSKTTSKEESLLLELFEGRDFLNQKIIEPLQEVKEGEKVLGTMTDFEIMLYSFLEKRRQERNSGSIPFEIEKDIFTGIVRKMLMLSVISRTEAHKYVGMEFFHFLIKYCKNRQIVIMSEQEYRERIHVL